MALTKVRGDGVQGMSLLSTSTALTLDANGRVAKSLQPAFMARSNAGNNGNTWEAGQNILFQTITTNVGSHYSASNGRFTAPVAGFYHFNFTSFAYNGGTIANGATSTAMLSINGTNIIALVYALISATNYAPASGSASVYLSASDYVNIKSQAQGFYADSSNLYCHFSGFLVG